MQIAETGAPILRTDTGTVSKVSGTLIGFYVNNTAGGTLVLRSGADGAATGTAISGTITPVIGFHQFNAYCPAGCHATIAVAGLDVTFFFAAG